MKSFDGVLELTDSSEWKELALQHCNQQNESRCYAEGHVGSVGLFQEYDYTHQSNLLLKGKGWTYVKSGLLGDLWSYVTLEGSEAKAIVLPTNKVIILSKNTPLPHLRILTPSEVTTYYDYYGDYNRFYQWLLDPISVQEGTLL